MTLKLSAKVLSTSAFLSTLFLVSVEPALAKLEMDGMFNDHMVLQSNQPLTFWGIGTPGDTVGIKIGERKGVAAVQPNGEWRMTVDAVPPGGPYELVAVASHDKLTLRDVYVGEVWFCSGQYNMTAKVKDTDKPGDAPVEVDPRIRFVQVPTRIALTPQKDFDAQWTILDSSNIGNVPSLPLHFAQRLNKELNVAVGVIVGTANGSPIEAWMSRDAFSTFPEGRDIVPKIDSQYYRAARAVMGKADSSNGAGAPRPGAPGVATPGNAAIPSTSPSNAATPPSGSASAGSPEMTIENVANALMQNSTSALSGDMSGSVPAPAGSITTPGAAIAATVPSTNSALDPLPPGATSPPPGSTGSPSGSAPVIQVPTSMLVPQFPPRKRTPKAVTPAASDDEDAKLPTGKGSSPEQKNGQSAAKTAKRADQGKPSNQKDAKDQPDLRNASNVKVSAASSLFNGMIAPVAPYTVKGILWYQGEANFVAKRYDNYHKFFAALVRDWRKAWQPAVPTFLFVQLPAFGTHEVRPDSKSPFADMRERQAQGCLIPSTYMVVALDGSEGATPGFDDTNKSLIADRLATTALATQYNKPYAYRGPSFDSATVEGNKVRLHFRHATRGLKAKGDTLKGFAIAGEDKQLYWANASIEGDSVVLAAPEVLHPSMVVYGWQANPEANLYNGDGLPAAPFKKRFE